MLNSVHISFLLCNSYTLIIFVLLILLSILFSSFSIVIHSYFFFNSLFDSVARIGAPNYVPSIEDILACRIRTAAFAQAVYNYNNVTFK